MRKAKGLVGFAVFLAVGLLTAAPAYAKERVIPEGIYVGAFSLGGMTETEAEQKLKEYTDGLGDQDIILDVDGTTFRTTAKALGFYWSNPDEVKEAAERALSGNLIEQYMAMKNLQKEPLEIPLETAVDEAKVEDFIQEQCADLTAEPQNAAITRENGAFVITPGVTGKVVDISATKKVLDGTLAGMSEQVNVKAVVVVKEPDISEADLSSISDVLGTFSTDFSSSGAARSKNLANGASKINGHVLLPGETLSGYECMNPFTTSNGYYTAAAYENGQVVDSVGGGVCQIATTLYNASLRAELEIVQRQNHSMVVGYVKPSMDAAIAGTYKDIKVTNNYSTPIYVEGAINGRTLTFTIYGQESRPANRQISYVSETLSVTDPGAPTERVDPSLAPGVQKRVQSAHRGMRSRLWKVVTVDGVETERTLLHTDTYNASKAIIMVGPAASEAVEPVDMIQPNLTESLGEAPTPVEGPNGGPGVTAPVEAPTPGEEPAPVEAPPVVVAPAEAAPEAPGE